MMENEQKLKSLPLELQFEILSRLPLKKLVGLKCLSRWWNVEISSPRMSKLFQKHRKSVDGGSIILVNQAAAFHFDFHSNILRELPPPPNIRTAQVFASCNGLLLFVEPREDTLVCVIYNPVTGASALLPPLVIDLPHHLGPNIRSYGLHLGFGYDSTNEDYQILRLVSCRKQDDVKTTHLVLLAYLYSMKMNSWKKIKPDLPNNCPFGGSQSNDMVYCNNTFYWISREITDRYGDNIISAFNVSSGRYYVLPKLPDGKSIWLASLVVLKDCLHLSCCDYDIWIMKECGVKHSWTKLLCCSRDELSICYKDIFMRPSLYAYSADEQELLLGINIEHMTFVCYNLQTRQLRKLQLTNPRLQSYINPFYCSVRPWMPSLAYPSSF